MGTKAYIPPDIDLSEAGQTFQQPAAQTSNPLEQFDGGIFSINHYRRYFNLSTNDFFQQVLNSINFLSKAEDIQQVGDLYGAIWITATVIFVLFFANTSSNLLVQWLKGSGDGKYQYNFNLFTGAISLLYGYTFLIPFALYVISVFYFKFTDFFTLTKIISIYGYANSVWIPSALLSILRGLLANHRLLSSILKWVVVLFGGVVSAASISTKVYPVLKNSSLSVGQENLALLLMVLLGLAHAGFIIAIKVLFFGDLKVV